VEKNAANVTVSDTERHFVVEYVLTCESGGAVRERIVTVIVIVPEKAINLYPLPVWSSTGALDTTSRTSCNLRCPSTSKSVDRSESS
jgi:hypothetical protein